MRLTTKGLLLIAIPTVFELALLMGLVQAQAKADEAAQLALRSRDVLRQTNAILEPVLLEAVRTRGAVLQNDRGAHTPVAFWIDVDRDIDRRVNIVADNPAQVERAAHIRQRVQAYRQWSDRVQYLVRTGRTEDVFERFRSTSNALQRR
jgi:CHASE3 domain sensor protein